MPTLRGNARQSEPPRGVQRGGGPHARRKIEGSAPAGTITLPLVFRLIFRRPGTPEGQPERLFSGEPESSTGQIDLRVERDSESLS
jgi:hypothetical protein